MKTEELINCPLCDGPAFLKPFKPNYIWSLGCEACKIVRQFIGPDELENAISTWNTRKHIQPVPELKGSYPVVLYLPSREDADELIQAMREVKPNMEMRHL